MTTMLIITIVKSSLALSLGLVGALSIVRFRTAIKEPEELAYLFLCIAIGLGFGANQTVITILGLLLILAIISLSRKFVNNFNKTDVLYLTVSSKSKEKLRVNNIIDILKQDASDIELKRLYESEDSKEISFVISFYNDKSLIKVRDNIYKLDEKLEVTLLDNSKTY